MKHRAFQESNLANKFNPLCQYGKMGHQNLKKHYCEFLRTYASYGKETKRFEEERGN